MLKRNCVQDKKKKKKTDIDRKRQTISQLIERELKENNSRQIAAEQKNELTGLVTVTL